MFAMKNDKDKEEVMKKLELLHNWRGRIRGFREFMTTEKDSRGIDNYTVDLKKLEEFIEMLLIVALNN